MKENEDKVPADKKSALETPLNSLKEAVKTQNVADIDRYTEELNKVMGEIYSSMSGQGAGPQGPEGPQGPQGPQGGPDYGPQGGNDAPDQQ